MQIWSVSIQLAGEDPGAAAALAISTGATPVPFGATFFWPDPAPGQLLLPAAGRGFFTADALPNPVALLSRKAFPASLGSLFGYPGSVISTGVNESLGGAVLPAGYATYTDLASRPAVQLSPRTGYTGPGMIITATVTCDYPIKKGSDFWTVGGNAIAAGGFTSGPPGDPPTTCGPYIYTWATTAAAIGVTAGSFLRFSCQERPPTEGCEGNGLPAIYALGVNECWF